MFPMLLIACTGGGEFIANRAPQAFAGFDQISPSGATLILDGRQSSDPDGNALVFAWTLLEPLDGSVVLDDGDGPSPSLTGSPGFSGRSIVQLIVSDGVESSFPDLVAIHFSATASSLPVARAGNNFLHPDPTEPLVLRSETAGTDLEQRWLHILGPSEDLLAIEPGPEAEVDELIEGPYLFALLVEDTHGVSLPDFLAVAVGPSFTASDLPQITGPNRTTIGVDTVFRATHSEAGHWSIVNAPGDPPLLNDPEPLGAGATSIRLTFEARGRYVISVTAASGLTDWHALEVL
ncbi:MAG: hypothetical protein CMH55_00570 [Myxococcales bacterium]|nr:hypothetical protein [Myxococcales bacterium]